MANALLKDQKSGTRLLIFTAIFFVFIAVGAVIFMFVASAIYDVPLEKISNPDLTSPAVISALSLMNGGAQIVGFLLASLFFMYLFGKRSVNGFWIKFPTILILFSPILMVLFNPLIGITAEFNALLIPEGSWLESIFKPMEEQAKITTQAMLVMPNINALMKNIIFVAVIPAVCEEFLFRGVLQSQFSKIFKNVHLGIWVAAFLFSAIHMQFYGFIPRMLMGALLGYMLVWTGSIWAPILAHFTNNAVAVYLSYYVQHEPGLTDELLEQQTNTSTIISIGIILFALALWFFWKNNRWSQIEKEYLEDSSGVIYSNTNTL